MQRLRLPPSGDPLLDEPTLDDMIADALRDICSVKDWPWLITTTALTFAAGVAALPSTCVKTRDLVVNGWRARPAEQAEFLDQASYATMFMWAVIGPNIQLSPVPTVSPTNTFYYVQSEPLLTSDITSPLVPEAHQTAVISRVCYYAELRRAKADAAVVHNTQYELDIKRMMDATKRANRPRQIREAGYQRWASW